MRHVLGKFVEMSKDQNRVLDSRVRAYGIKDLMCR